MKKYFLVLPLLCGLVLSLTSCNGDKDDDLDGTGQKIDIIDSGKYGKFEKLTINEMPVYNCIEAIMGGFSTYEFLPNYLTWRNNKYEYEPAVQIFLTMYDAPTIEAGGIATITMWLKETSFDDGPLKSGAVDVTSNLLAISVASLSKTEFYYNADYKEQFSVLAGSIKLKKKKDKKYIVTFDNFKIKIKDNDVSIKGSATFKENQVD